MAWGYGVFNLELHSAAISCWKGTTVVEQLVSLDHGEMFCRITSLHQQLAGGIMRSMVLPGRLRAVCELDVSRVSANPCQDSPTNDNSSICLASSIGLCPFAGLDWPVNTLLVILIGLLPF